MLRLTYHALLACLLGGIAHHEGRAQQSPVVSTYMYHPMFVSPAAASGYGANTAVRAMHRTQWAGYDDFNRSNRHAGQTQLLTATLQLRDSTGGMGLVAMRDKLAELQTLDVKLSYAYHLYLGQNSSAGIGVGAGIRSKSIDFDQYRVKHPDDALLGEGFATQTQPNATIGFWVRHEQFHFGGSYANFFSQAFEDVNAPDEAAVMLTGEYRIGLGGGWALSPGFLWVNETGENALAFHTMGNYQGILDMGLAYRHEEAMTFIAGAWLLEDQSLRVGLATDLVVQNRDAKSSASYEVSLGYVFSR